MCHIILMLPLLTLPVFWLMPLTSAVALYVVILIFTGLIYILAIRAMRRPVETGSEEILNSTGEVIGTQGNLTQVRVHSEIWHAMSSDELHEGDRVKVVSMKGLTLNVRRTG